ncbi:MAG: radical SAM protein [Myxococcota bacterium]|nr:radical SAM protein [Myxococcota bacterium]
MLERLARLQCSAPWSGCTVHWTGQVFPCCSVCGDFGRSGGHSHRMLLGDLNRRGLAEILGGAAAWALRRAWVEGELDRHCCGHCHASRVHTCSPYFRDDVVARYMDRAYERDGEELRRLRDEPFAVSRLEVQIDSRCQLACGFCARDYAPTGAPELRRAGSMDPLLFERLLDEVMDLGGPGAELFTHWIGEPLLHPQRERIFRTASERPFFTTTIVTNGVALSGDLVDFLLGLSRPPAVYVSLHAASREAFLRTTGADRFEHVRANVERLVRRRAAAGRQDDLRLFVGYTVADTNIDDLPGFLEDWTALLGDLDEAPSIHLNGRGPMNRNVLIVVADGLDPFGDAMRRAFWTVEEARAHQEPSLDALEHLARPGAWREHGDPDRVFLEHVARIEQRLVYARGLPGDGRERELLSSLLLAQACSETERRGAASDQTIGRLMAHLRERPEGERGRAVAAIRRAIDTLVLRPGPRLAEGLSAAVRGAGRATMTVR